jgi:hypothetical protein
MYMRYNVQWRLITLVLKLLGRGGAPEHDNLSISTDYSVDLSSHQMHPAAIFIGSEFRMNSDFILYIIIVHHLTAASLSFGPM